MKMCFAWKVFPRVPHFYIGNQFEKKKKKGNQFASLMISFKSDNPELLGGNLVLR